jgi:pimeloyl-ACP methyl ester carboxylesterase
MPYAGNAGVRIHYELTGTGPPLVLQHGFTQCLQDWAECGYVAPLQAKYRLLLIDARGHGRSDNPHDAASYALAHHAADVTAVLDAVGIERAHFWGYSMGGYIGFGMAKYAPKRVDRLVIGGQHPYAGSRAGLRQWLQEGKAGGGDALVAGFEKFAGPISDVYAQRLRDGDLDAWLAFTASDRENMEDMLPAMAMPCLLYSGDADAAFSQAKSATERIPNARFVGLPGLAHLPAFVESRAALPPVTEFLAAAK